jgi:cardiolipin synthase
MGFVFKKMPPLRELWRKNRSIPNLLSLMRIALIPFILIFFLQNNDIMAAILLTLSFFTDIIDGFIARRFNQITPLGQILDPIADKLTQAAVAFCLCFTFTQIIPLFGILLIKELVMGILGLISLNAGQKPFTSFWWGKVSTGAFYTGVIIILSLHRIIGSCFIWAISIAICFLMLYSMIRYTIFMAKRFKV